MPISGRTYHSLDADIAHTAGPILNDKWLT